MHLFLTSRTGDNDDRYITPSEAQDIIRAAFKGTEDDPFPFWIEHDGDAEAPYRRHPPELILYLPDGSRITARADGSH